MRHVHPTYANVTATFAAVVALGGGAIALAAGGATVNACVKNDGLSGAGTVRIVTAGTVCPSNEHAFSWAQEGPAGPTGAAGPTGPNGSPDTPSQILDKLAQVDGDGSGLDASFLDGINSTGFLRNTGKAADADKLDGINSTAFVKRGTASGGTIGLSSIAANKCSDVTLGIGSLKVGDIFVVNVAQGDSLPANLTMNVLDVPVDGQVHVRICNGTNTASIADNDIKLRWYSLRP